MPVSTDKELYEVVKNHLISQRARSTNSSGACAYRGDSSIDFGRKCAIGILIDDDRYHPELEGQDATSYEIQTAVIDSNPGLKITLVTEQLMSVLQRIHDCIEPKHWRLLLDRVDDPTAHVRDINPDDSAMENRDQLCRDFNEVFYDPDVRNDKVVWKQEKVDA